MLKTKQEFVALVRRAMRDHQSDAYVELYRFLVSCFVKADTDLDGKVHIDDVDAMITEAAALPRMFGLAPKASDTYPNDEARLASRVEMFSAMDTNTDGKITLEEWIRFSMEHIMSKVNTLPMDVFRDDNTTQGEFITFMKKAVKPDTPEYREMYQFLLSCFQEADKNRDGAISAIEFDSLIEVAAHAPRRLGLAPSSQVMFKTDAERLAKRIEYFQTMDVNKDGTISFDEWLRYARNHIMDKVAQM